MIKIRRSKKTSENDGWTPSYVFTFLVCLLIRYHVNPDTLKECTVAKPVNQSDDPAGCTQKLRLAKTNNIRPLICLYDPWIRLDFGLAGKWASKGDQLLCRRNGSCHRGGGIKRLRHKKCNLHVLLIRGHQRIHLPKSDISISTQPARPQVPRPNIRSFSRWPQHNTLLSRQFHRRQRSSWKDHQDIWVVWERNGALVCRLNCKHVAERGSLKTGLKRKWEPNERIELSRNDHHRKTHQNRPLLEKQRWSQ